MSPTPYDLPMDHLAAARGFVDRAFPLASTAIVAGSTARGTRTPTSDVDLLLLGPSAMLPPGQDSLAATYTSGDETTGRHPAPSRSTC